MPAESAHPLDAAIEAVRAQHGQAALPAGNVGGARETIAAILSDPAFKEAFSLVLKEIVRRLAGGALMMGGRGPGGETPSA